MGRRPRPRPPTSRRKAPGRFARAPAGGLVAAALLAALLGDSLAFALAGPAQPESQSQPQATRAPLSRLDQIGPALRACWAAPAGSEGSEITFRFGLDARGALKGAPIATYSRLSGNASQQRAFVAAALLALQRCTPLHMTPDLGRVVASRVLTLRFSAQARTRAVDI